MHFNERFAEAIKTTGIAAENTSGNTSGWIAVQDFDRIAFTVVSDTAAIAFTLEQATDGSGTAAKALVPDTVADHAAGTKDLTLVTVDGAVTVEALAEQMDIDGGFTHVELVLASVAAEVAIVTHGCGVRVRPAYNS